MLVTCILHHRRTVLGNLFCKIKFIFVFSFIFVDSLVFSFFFGGEGVDNFLSMFLLLFGALPVVCMLPW